MSNNLQHVLNQAFSGMGDAVRAKLYITGLNDTPTGYLGHSGDYLVVNDGETGIHFTGIEKIAQDLTDYGFAGGSSTIPSYTDLPDVTENDGKIVASGCDLYHSCNGTWNKVGGESIPPPAEAPGCVTNLEEYNQYQEYKDGFLADNLGLTAESILNNGTKISDLIFDACLFPESNLENERNTVVIDETTYKWGMFAGPQTINLSAEGYSDGQGNDCVFSEWTSSNANFGDSSSANTTVFVDTDLSITGSFECLIAPIQPSCDRVVLHLQPTAGETITDKSSDEHAITVVGDTTVDNTKTLFGGDTMNFDGNGDYLSLPASEDWDLGSGDFTIEFWVNFDTLSNLNTSGHGSGASIIGNATNGGSVYGWLFYLNYQGLFTFLYSNSSGSFSGLGVNLLYPLETKRWYHIAVSRKNNTLRGFVDGSKLAETAFTTYRHSSLPLELGRRTRSPISSIQNYFAGQIQDVRISKKAVYTSNFNPPTNLLANLCSEQPSCEDVALHLQPDTGETIADKSDNEHVITTVGDTVVDNTATLFGGGTMNFDGDGDYLSVGDTSTFKFLHDGTTDYTVECWLQVSNLLNNAPSPSRIMSTARNSTDSGIDFFVNENGLLGYWIYGGQNQQYYKTITLGSNSALQPNTWYHIVLKNTVTQELKIYINGVEQVGTTIIDPQKVSTLDATSMLLVGQIVGLDRPFNGQIQDFRISKKAVYTSNFTPPTNLLINPC